MRAWAALVLLLLLGVAVASHPEPAVSRRVINLPGRTDALPFSNAVLAGDTLYLSGTIGIDPATGRPPANIEDEARLVLDNLKRVLEAAGMRMEDLVSVTVYCPDLSLYDRFNAVYRTYFTKELPARAFIGSGPLLRGGHFEVQGIAVRR